MVSAEMKVYHFILSAQTLRYDLLTCTTASVYPVLLSDIGRMRTFLNALGLHTHIETLAFYKYPEEDERPYRSAVEPFASFFFRPTELFTSLKTIDFGFVKPTGLEEEDDEEEGEDDDDGDFDDSEDEEREEEEETPEPLLKELLRRYIEENPCFAAKFIGFQDSKVG